MDENAHFIEQSSDIWNAESCTSSRVLPKKRKLTYHLSKHVDNFEWAKLNEEDNGIYCSSCCQLVFSSDRRKNPDYSAFMRHQNSEAHSKRLAEPTGKQDPTASGHLAALLPQPSADKDLKCGICHQLLRIEQHLQCPKGTHGFCVKCVKVWLTQGKDACPLDGEHLGSLEQLTSCLTLDQRLRQALVKCGNWVVSCDWIGPHDQLQVHLRVCQKELVGCDYEKFGCQGRMKREELKMHRFNCMETHLNLIEKKYVEDTEKLKNEIFMLRNEKQDMSSQVGKLVHSNEELTKEVKDIHKLLVEMNRAPQD